MGGGEKDVENDTSEGGTQKDTPILKDNSQTIFPGLEKESGNDADNTIIEENRKEKNDTNAENCGIVDDDDNKGIPTDNGKSKDESTIQEESFDGNVGTSPLEEDGMIPKSEIANKIQEIFKRRTRSSTRNADSNNVESTPIKVEAEISLDLKISACQTLVNSPNAQTLQITTPPPPAPIKTEMNNNVPELMKRLVNPSKPVQHFNDLRPEVRSLIQQLAKSHQKPELIEHIENHFGWPKAKSPPAVAAQLSPKTSPPAAAAAARPAPVVAQPMVIAPQPSLNAVASRRNRSSGKLHLQNEIDGFPHKKRGLKTLQHLTEAWENGNKRCPYPECNANLRTNFQLFSHWYVTHMAPGYCKVYPCYPCKQDYKDKTSFQKHIRYKHDLSTTQAEAIVSRLELMWETKVSDKDMIKLLPAPESLPSLSFDIISKFGLNKEFQCYSQHHANSMPHHHPPPQLNISVNVNHNLPVHCETSTNASNTNETNKVEDVPVCEQDIPPKNKAVPGLPWRQRDEVSLKNLITAWKESNLRCPHPQCNGQHWRNIGIKYTRCSDIVKHWFRTHMAPGYCKVYACPCCPTWIKYLQNFKQHLRTTHQLAANMVDEMVDQMEARWENLVKSGDEGILEEAKPNANSSESSSSTKSALEAGSARMAKLVEALSNRAKKMEEEKNVVKENPVIQPEVSQNPIRIDEEIIECAESDVYEVLDLDQIPGEKKEVPGLPWKGMSPETSQALGGAWEANDHICPHPLCDQALNSRKAVFAHWHQNHLLPGCGIAYTCYGRNEKDKPCDKVFDNKWDLITHCREYHRYTDNIIQEIFAKIRAVRASGDEKQHQALKGPAQPRAVPGERRKRRPNARFPIDTPPQIREIKPITSNLEEIPSPLVIIPTQPNTPTPSQNGLLGETKIKQEKGTSSEPTHTLPKIDPTSIIGNALASFAQCPPDSKNFSAVAAALFNAETASTNTILPQLLWKAIIAAWKVDKKCPHPGCENSQILPNHNQMLGHWLRGHMDQSRGRLYPCLYGNDDTGEWCTNVYVSADELTAHLLKGHGYQNDDIRKMLANMKGEWDKLSSADADDTVPKSSSPSPSDAQSTEATTSDEGAAINPAKKRKVVRSLSPIVLD